MTLHNKYLADNSIAIEKPTLTKIDNANKWLAILLGFMIPTTTAGTNITALIILILFLTSGEWGKKYNTLKNNPLATISVMLYLALAIGVLYSEASPHDAMARLMKYNKLLIVPILIYLFQDLKHKKLGIYAFASAMLLSVAIGFLHAFFKVPLPSGTPNPGNIFIHHIITSAFMAILVVFCLYQYITQKNKISQVIWLCFALASTYYVYFITGTRTGFLILSILILYFAFHVATSKNHFSIKKNLTKILVLIISLIITISVGLNYSKTFTARVYQAANDAIEYKKNNVTWTSNGTRLSWYVNAPKLIIKKPIFGYGTGSIKDVYTANFAKKHLPLTANPHNQYIEIAFQLGIIGLALYLALLFFAYKNINNDPLISLMGKSTIIMFVIGSCINSWLLDLAPGFFFCYIAALATKPIIKDKLRPE